MWFQIDKVVLLIGALLMCFIVGVPIMVAGGIPEAFLWFLG